jgi:hypothetical protein
MCENAVKHTDVKYSLLLVYLCYFTVLCSSSSSSSSDDENDDDGADIDSMLD